LKHPKLDLSYNNSRDRAKQLSRVRKGRQKNAKTLKNRALIVEKPIEELKAPE